MTVLLALGAAAVYSVDLSRGEGFGSFKRHLVAIGLGLAVFVVMSIQDYTLFRTAAPALYGVAVLLLVGVLFLGSTIRGTTGWFHFGILSFQPAEFAKIALVLMLAFYLSRRYRNFKSSSTFIGTLLVAGVLQGLIILQPDMGSALLLGFLWAGVMLFMNTRKRYWAILISLFLLVSAVGWFFILRDYQKDRVLTFIYPDKDPLGAGYNVTQSIIAIGSGSWKGRGLGFGSQSQLRFLPEAQSDFVFAVIGEELGFIGIAVIMICFSIMIGRMLILLPRVPDDFSGLVVVGVSMVLLAQFLVNVGGTLGLLPVTGVPLPLISYGGSSILATMTMLGFVQSVYRSASRTAIFSQNLST
jgi:rod shape determining protein RodA